MSQEMSQEIDLGVQYYETDEIARSQFERGGVRIRTVGVFRDCVDENGRLAREEVGCMVFDVNGPNAATAHFHGGFLYHAGYQGKPVSPHLDHRERLFFPLTSALDYNARTKCDVHQVFAQMLPDQWGSQVISSIEPEYARADVSRKLELLEETKYGPFTLSSTGSELTLNPLGSEALEKAQVAINRFVQEKGGTALKEFIEASPDDHSSFWALYVNGGQEPKVALRVNKDGTPETWIAKFAPKGDADLVALEVATIRAAALGKIAVPPTFVAKSQHGTMCFSRRYDQAADEKVPKQTICLAAVMDRGKFEFATYAEMADALKRFSSNPSDDVDALFRRMVFNAYANNTDDHLGQFEMLETEDGFRLAPAYDLIVDDVIDELPHKTKFVGGGRPQYSSEWIGKQADSFGIHRGRAFLLATEAIKGVEAIPALMNELAITDRRKANVVETIRLDELKALRESLPSAAQEAERKQQATASVTGFGRKVSM